MTKPLTNHPARSRRKPEPQGSRQRAGGCARHDKRPSRRREAQHPRAGRARRSDAEHQPSSVGVSFPVIPGCACLAQPGIHTPCARVQHEKSSLRKHRHRGYGYRRRCAVSGMTSECNAGAHPRHTRHQLRFTCQTAYAVTTRHRVSPSASPMTGSSG